MRQIRRSAFVALVVVSAVARRATAQVAEDTSHRDRVWLSGGIGPGAANGESRLGGGVTLWWTHDNRAFALRRAGASRGLDTGDTYDTALLFGARHREPHITTVAAAGLGIGQSTSRGGGVEPSELVLALSAEAALNLRFVGIGVGAVASAGGRRRFFGVALVLELGLID